MDFKWILVRLGGLLGTSWGVLGRLGDVLGASWRVLGASWAHLGASWSVLERLGHLQASKIEKSLKNQRKTIKNHPNINLTRHGTGSADFFLDASCSLRFPKQVSWNVFGSQSLPQAPGRSARLTVVSFRLSLIAFSNLF